MIELDEATLDVYEAAVVRSIKEAVCTIEALANGRILRNKLVNRLIKNLPYKLSGMYK